VRPILRKAAASCTVKMGGRSFGGIVIFFTLNLTSIIVGIPVGSQQPPAARLFAQQVTHLLSRVPALSTCHIYQRIEFCRIERYVYAYHLADPFTTKKIRFSPDLSIA
jgi:hypothetical protein